MTTSKEEGSKDAAADPTTTELRSLSNDKSWQLSVNDRCVRIECLEPDCNWTILSSAVLNGGLQKISSSSKQRSSSLHILNAKVPAEYDGISPDPKELLRQIGSKEISNARNSSANDTTIGLLTAASMKTLRVASTQATGSCGKTFIVDAIVTAGISNSRVAGADADMFYFVADDSSNSNADDSPDNDQPKDTTNFGTINTIILTNMALDESSALIEAYTVAIEAKCRAVTDLGIKCAKHPNETATGTGTDSTVLVTPTTDDDQDESKTTAIPYAQKHTLVGELIGQAVYEATKEAMQTNLTDFYRGHAYPSLMYRLRCYRLQLWHALQEGHLPLVPSRPMVPIPTPSGWVLLVGVVGMIWTLAVHIFLVGGEEDAEAGQCQSQDYSILPEQATPAPSASILLAVLWGDRFLGSHLMPLAIHPVVLVGKLITNLLRLVPEPYFQPTHPILGFLSGCSLWGCTAFFSVGTAWCVLQLPRLAALHVPTMLGLAGVVKTNLDSCSSTVDPGWPTTINSFLVFANWILHVFLVRGALSLQLLCNVALQMAHFLERGQLQKARAQLSWLCSRDPSQLQADELAGGTLESLSENLSDSVVSPLFYYVLFGPLGAFAFRTMNTLDSRVGFRGRCEWVGKFSARCDDLLNLIPARLTALLLVVAAGLLQPSSGFAPVIQKGLSVAWRDASQCDSPNAGWPMATFAGILDVRLEKRGQYSLNGPPNGGTGKAPGHQDIRRGHTIAQLAGILAFLVAMAASAIWNSI
ncbi:Cobalamin biosynthesis protein [Seminavis robusta]|uniref:Cobalamin biosynthesis protein n=1 Tax=Seminavis robusta TaxID=568900 RepID=A0A9N8E1E0_9STRA|nr:Cobalamin biosynthesis protein [Seminavis robusta]|eukprot:Sro461_g147700.1 Cobalamin biosynthesis protein (757) ;mRNA; r:14496-16766